VERAGKDTLQAALSPAPNSNHYEERQRKRQYGSGSGGGGVGAGDRRRTCSYAASQTLELFIDILQMKLSNIINHKHEPDFAKYAKERM
jgi:hypothetical protein